jgi:phytoene dehydrogenase-like protein
MSEKDSFDTIVVGSGPNGLSAAITLARAGRSVAVFEAKNIAGGGVSSQELTLPGFIHDVGSAVFPLAVSTPFFKTIDKKETGLEWTFPPASVAHPFDDGSAVILYRSLDKTLEQLGADARAYERLVKPFTAKWDALAEDVLNPLHRPRHPLLFSCFGFSSIWPVSMLARLCFKTLKVRSLFAGLGAHAILPLGHAFTSAFALIMSITAHNPGWPIPRGGSGAVSQALIHCFESLGGKILTSSPVESMDDLPAGADVFFDLTPRQVLAIAGKSLPHKYCQKISGYRYGPGVFKVDWALDGPIPWKARECSHAGTVHVGGTIEEIELCEKQAWEGITPDKPFILCAQPSLFDDSRAPKHKHTAWAYCHVPAGSDVDMTRRIEQQIKRFAPGFQDRILARHVMSPHDLETFNANFIGGDISGGAQDWRQLITRPVLSLNPYSMPADGLYLCSASTPPGGGVHGMCGYNAAMSALKNRK